jgi:phage terminase large subunit
MQALRKLDGGVKRMILTWHRRSGKDVTIFNWCIKELVKNTCTCFYVMPTYSQGKKVIWDSSTNDGFRILDFIPPQVIAQKNQQEMKIRFFNGSLFQIIGSDNIDSLMGTNPKIVVFSEYALQSPDAWEFIRPILKVNGGVAIFISTPRGRNHFFDMFEMAKNQPDWYAERLTYKDTGVLTDEDIEKEIAEGMSEELAEQEYCCSFDRGIDGAFYAKLITKMRNEERILPLSYDPYKLVHVSFDLGWDDCTAIIFFQLDGEKIKIIDCEEHSNKTLHWYKNLLMEKGYKYGTYLFPHDVEHVDGLSTGLTRKELLEDMQIPVTTVPRSFIVDGIEAVKVLLSSRILINSEKCQPLIKSLENYHREWDDKRKVYSNKPNHNWSSHFCDSLRYLAEGLKLIDSGRKTLDEDMKAIRKYFD